MAEVEVTPEIVKIVEPARYVLTLSSDEAYALHTVLSNANAENEIYSVWKALKNVGVDSRNSQNPFKVDTNVRILIARKHEN